MDKRYDADAPIRARRRRCGIHVQDTLKKIHMSQCTMPMHMHMHRRVVCIRTLQAKWLDAMPTISSLHHPLSIDQLTSRSLNRGHTRKRWTETALRPHTSVQPIDSLGRSLLCPRSGGDETGRCPVDPQDHAGDPSSVSQESLQKRKAGRVASCGPAAVWPFSNIITALQPPSESEAQMAPT